MTAFTAVGDKGEVEPYLPPRWVLCILGLMETQWILLRDWHTKAQQCYSGECVLYWLKELNHVEIPMRPDVLFQRRVIHRKKKSQNSAAEKRKKKIKKSLWWSPSRCSCQLSSKSFNARI